MRTHEKTGGNYPRFLSIVSLECPLAKGGIPGESPTEPALPKLTKRFVDAMKPVKRDTLYRDEDLSGFALRAKPSGARTWVVQYRNSAGRTRKLALGRVGVLTPDEARRQARKALVRVAGGEDPSATRNAARGAMTVADLCHDYLAAAERGLVFGKGKRPKSETTLASDRSRIDCHILPQLGTMSAADVGQADVRRFMHAVQSGKTAKVAKSTSGRTVHVKGGTASATRTGSAGSSARGSPVLTLQKAHARVHVSPMIMNVACFFSQHSPILGQPASSQTVTSPCSLTIARVAAHCAEPGALTLIQLGLRATG